MSNRAPHAPKIASHEDWLIARKALLAREKELTHLRDAVSAARRELPENESSIPIRQHATAWSCGRERRRSGSRTADERNNRIRDAPG